MLAPTPVLKPSPLDIGGLFSASFEALKRKFGLLVLITLLPALLIMVVVAVSMMLMIPAAVAAANGDASTLPAGIIFGMLVMTVGMILAALVQLKSYGMLSLAAYEIAQGQSPDFRGVLSRSRGFLPRMASVIAITIGAVIAFYVVLIVLMVGVFGATGSGGRSSGSGAFAALGVFMLFIFILVPLGFFLAVKLLYTLPAVAIEELGGIDGLKRSWRLTRGAFWRTFGYYLVASLAVSAIGYAVSLVGQLALVPLGLSTSSISQTSDPAQAVAMLATLIPAMLAVTALQLVVQVVTLPFVQAYITYMFIDQVRRTEMPAAPSYGYPGAPGYYAQPGQYYGQPQQPYPPQTYPPQGQPGSGTGWQAPGQTQPPQQWGGQQQNPPQQWGGQQQNPPQQGWNGQQGQWPPSDQDPPQS